MNKLSRSGNTSLGNTDVVIDPVGMERCLGTKLLIISSDSGQI